MPDPDIPSSIRILLDHLHPNFSEKQHSSVVAAARLILDLEEKLGFSVTARPVADLSFVTLTWGGGQDVIFKTEGASLPAALFRAVDTAMTDPRCRSAFPAAVLTAIDQDLPGSAAPAATPTRRGTGTSGDSHLDALVRHLQGNQEQLLNAWLVAICDDPAIPSADRLTLEALRDDFPDMLRELIECLRAGDQSADNQETRATAAAHGNERWRNGFRLDEVLHELARVRELLLAQIEQFEGDTFPAKLRSTVNLTVRRFFDKVAARSARQFVRAQEGELTLRATQLEHAYEQVHAATEQTRALAESRLTLIRAVNHELRNALQPVTYAAQILVTEKDGRYRQGFSAELESTAQRLGALLDRLGQLSTVLAGEAQLEPALVRLPDFIEALKTEHAPEAARKGLRFECVVSGGEMDVISDKDKLHEIATVLLANALKYTTAGGVRLEAEAVPEHDRWSLRVTDTGPGITPAQAHNVFQEFHSSNTLGNEGMRLGLVLARYLARLLGGDLTYQAGKDRGSSFELNLPRVAPQNSPMTAGNSQR